jgi:hypothetical protein
MPGPSYPPAAPTISGELVTISRFLQSPTLIGRRLRDLTDLRFISDQILTQRFRSSGGAVMYEVSEPFLNTRPVKAVAPGSEYPRDTPAQGVAAMAAVTKWGEAFFISDERIKRSVFAGDEVTRQLTKAVNTVANKIEGLTTSAVSSAITNTHSAAATWDNASAQIFRDVEVAAAKITDLNMGYNPDTLLMSTSKYALLMSDSIIANLRRREATDNPIYGGDIERVGKFNVVYTSAANLPSNDVWVIDSRQLGGMADEVNQDPGYATGAYNIQVQTMRRPERDGWDLWARRLTVPIVTEPGAGIRITGTGS